MPPGGFVFSFDWRWIADHQAGLERGARARRSLVPRPRRPRTLARSRSKTLRVHEETMARIVIAGCGAVGTLLGRRLAADGHVVWGLRRRAHALPPPFQPLPADLADPATLRALPDGIDYVFYTASAGRFDAAAYHAAYVDGVTNLIDALQAQGQRPTRLFFTSSTGVYGQTRGEWVDEDSPTEPSGFSGQSLLTGERLLHDGPFPATVVRLGGLYGPQPGRLVELVREGRAVCPAGAPRYTNRIHRDDAAAALRHLMGLPSPPAVCIGVDSEPADLAVVYRWLAARLGVPEPPTGGPGEGLRPQGGNKRCRNQRLLATGFTFRYPTFRDGYDALLAASIR
jgi:nucleoside-diphosphate-sugar epimerase